LKLKVTIFHYKVQHSEAWFWGKSIKFEFSRERNRNEIAKRSEHQGRSEYPSNICVKLPFIPSRMSFVLFRLSKKSVRLNPSACRFELRLDPLPHQKSVLSVNQRPLDLPFDLVT